MNMNTKMTFGKNLKDAIAAKNLTVAKLARMTGISRSNLFAWLNDRKPDVEQVKKVAIALEMSLNELLFGEPDEFAGDLQQSINQVFSKKQKFFSGVFKITLEKLDIDEDKNK